MVRRPNGDLLCFVSAIHAGNCCHSTLPAPKSARSRCEPAGQLEHHRVPGAIQWSVSLFFATLINQTLQTEPVVMLEQNAFLGHVRLVTALEFKIGEYDYSVALSSITARKSSGRATRCGIAMARWTRRLTLRPDGSIHLCAKR